MKKTIIQLVAFLAVSLLLGYGMVRIDRRLRAPSDTPPQVDTTTVLDTTTTPGSKPVLEIHAGFELVPVGTFSQMLQHSMTIAQLRDSLDQKPKVVVERDSVYIYVPLQEYTFTDHKTYEYAVRGYGVTELLHRSFQKTQYITNTVTKTEYRSFSFTLYPKVGMIGGVSFFSAQAGLGMDIAISQNRRWLFSPEAGYGLLYSGPERSLSHGWYGGASIKFNLIQVK